MRLASIVPTSAGSQRAVTYVGLEIIGKFADVLKVDPAEFFHGSEPNPSEKLKLGSSRQHIVWTRTARARPITIDSSRRPRNRPPRVVVFVAPLPWRFDEGNFLSIHPQQKDKKPSKTARSQR